MEQNNHELYHYGVKGMKWGVIRKRVTDRVTAYKKAREIDNETKAKIKEIQAKRRNEEIVKRAKANAAARVAAAKQNLNKQYPSAKQLEEAKKAAEAKRAENAKKVEEARKAKAEELAKVKAEKEKQKAEEALKRAGGTKPKTVADMSDDELRQAIARMQLVNQYKSLMPEQKSKGKERISKYTGKLVDQVIVPVALDAGKKYLTKTVNKALGLEVKADDYEALKKSYDTLKVKKDIQDIKKTLSKTADKEMTELKAKHEKAKLEKELAEFEKNRLSAEKQADVLMKEKEEREKAEEEKKKKKNN